MRSISFLKPPVLRVVDRSFERFLAAGGAFSARFRILTRVGSEFTIGC